MGEPPQDLDAEVLARIAFNTEQNRRLEKPHLPVETVMTMETVREQRRKVEELVRKMRESARLRGRVKEEESEDVPRIQG